MYYFEGLSECVNILKKVFLNYLDYTETSTSEQIFKDSKDFRTNTQIISFIATNYLTI